MSQMLMLQEEGKRAISVDFFFLAYYRIEFRISHENEWYIFFPFHVNGTVDIHRI